MEQNAWTDKIARMNKNERDFLIATCKSRMTYQGPNLTLHEPEGEMKPLCLAMMMRDIPFFEYVLQKGANVNTQDGFGNTPLHYTDYCIPLGETLLRKGANPHIKNKAGKTALEVSENARDRLNIVQSDEKNKILTGAAELTPEMMFILASLAKMQEFPEPMRRDLNRHLFNRALERMNLADIRERR